MKNHNKVLLTKKAGMKKFLKKREEEDMSDKMSEIDEVKEANTIDELDNFMHEQVIEYMKAKESGDVLEFKPKTIAFGEVLKKMGVENIHEALMMKAIERAMNDPYLKSEDRSGVNHWKEFEEAIYPLLRNDKEVTFH